METREIIYQANVTLHELENGKAYINDKAFL